MGNTGAAVFKILRNANAPVGVLNAPTRNRQAISFWVGSGRSFAHLPGADGKSRPAAWQRRIGVLRTRLGNGERLIDNSSMNKLHYERADYSVVVKNRAPPPKAWRWEIYRAGNANPIKLSSIYFETTAAARRAGKDALKELLNKLFA